MLWIHAANVPAEVIEFRSVRNIADFEFISPSVSPDVTPVLAEQRIAATAMDAEPLDAPGLGIEPNL